MSALTTRQSAQFDLYSRLLVEWNQRFNLTSQTTLITPNTLKTKHFDDSLTYSEAIKFAGYDLTKSLNIADVGSGAGFPGIPLKIMYPHWNLTLIEATTKKCQFLEEVITQLGLIGINIVNHRAEDVGAQFIAPANRFDVVVARAVASLDKLVTWCLPLLKKDGVIITQKGQQEALIIEKFKQENKNLKIKTLNCEEKVFIIIRTPLSS